MDITKTPWPKDRPADLDTPLTAGQVEQWSFESVWGVRVPKLTFRERREFTRLRRATWHTPMETFLYDALKRKVTYRTTRLARAKRRHLHVV